MTVILIFFCVHWFCSLFFHTFYLHRYASHQMYTTSKFWERFFYFCTWFFQGSSYLIPRAYGVMHRMHHEYSDTEKDPHSPHFFKDVWTMMVQTRKIYNGFVNNTSTVDPQFTADPLPEWKAMDKIGDSNITRLAWIAAYIAFYVAFVPAGMWYLYLLLPIHFLMGPVQGAVVNWCGHKYGYQNFDNGDHSRNTSPWGVVLLGELFQNNHHKFKDSPNFAKKWYELDPSYQVMKLMNFIGIIKLKPAVVATATPMKKVNAA
ncbi:stearoyl-CoA desaturase (delta-9 desaturase) [Chitinophaga terrae (ex Kim and Jung 2007)]|uniref:Stearoyl-CoA desaturase (Delta-9 desaturase) n=1 Tax=Chitinophaga terrae (ex Kim and Jung 2007) TaxID=408074 RepID=A0A1H4B873_9BACT|nr:acyl-CoA desaturase [Chitinophaga terrae (ex Kim and Jung 2007)]MDQ0106311.1 stearoyl-CoA desaturase (delta-9 desaturase) [Chitinophaga terrae (ex Kim and Jung 2007)]SEA44254.1 stearoyl-CoA desaturase (delta-9 desaturase) [Chitinophaga terrae (ex Kim and Jung 2007)]